MEEIQNRSLRDKRHKIKRKGLEMIKSFINVFVNTLTHIEKLQLTEVWLMFFDLCSVVLQLFDFYSTVVNAECRNNTHECG